MGGARCSYRNCTVRSNGVTHMFHYPVFDKMRCHQWLTNAQRHDFLNLKVSQLKNRVVCQHHFKPDNFMNYKMDKLKFDAVPTENGPFCEVKDWTIEDAPTALPIAPEEIDHERLSFKEKKVKFSVKYGDFLTNSETDNNLMQIDSTYSINYGDLVNNLALDNSDQQKSQSQSFSESKPSQHIVVVTEVPAEYDRDMNSESKLKENEENNCVTPVTPQSKPQNYSKIHILSEKRLPPAPVRVKGKLKPVAPDQVILPRDKKMDKVTRNVENIENLDVIIQNPQFTSLELSITKPQIFMPTENLGLEEATITPLSNQNYEINNTVAQNQIVNVHSVADIVQAVTPVPPETINKSNENIPLKNNNNRTVISNQSPRSLLKTKIPPERVAAIEEKRQFNKKLRDMIEFCLDDSSEKPIQSSKLKRENEVGTLKIQEELKKLTKVARKPSQYAEKEEQAATQKVSSFLSKEPDLPSINDYNMASLEARLKRMEDNLLWKISQNSKNILDLKNTLQTTAVEMKSVTTQTKEDEPMLKKQLFREISQFLSPEANNLIYEELFLDKYSKKPLSKTEHSRKRKLRK